MYKQGYEPMHDEESKNKFKAENGILLTKPLFFETADSDKSRVLYTLKDEAHKGYPSIKRLYIETEDTTEYVFAVTFFYSYSHFKKLLEVQWFRSVIDEAREELALRLAAKALLHIRQKADAGDIKANQYLLERKWEDGKKDKVGRPSKAAIKEEANRLFEKSNEIDEDLNRVLKFPTR